MNLLPLLLGFLLIKGFGKKDAPKGGADSLGSLFSNPDAMSMLPHVAKLFDSSATEQEKNDAMMALMTNPAVFDLVSKFTSRDKSGDEKHSSEPTDEKPDAPKGGKSDDGFSGESREFFRPVEKVAGVEISSKLYKLYDNWYIKK